MADYQEIPETVRSFLAAPGHPWSADLSEVAVAYATLCREANDRLRRCGEYLRRGMRSEAAHLAECQPKLLPLVDALRVSDPAAWSRACIANGLAPAPDLLADNLPQIEAARELETRLQPLLARHRLLALAKAPIRDRLEVLIALHDKDPGNPVWIENLRTLGAARLKEIRTESQAAYSEKNQAVLEKLAAELSAPGWQIDLPEDLSRGVERAIGLLRLESAKEELRPLLAQLRAAHAARDYQEAQPILAQWRDIIDSRQLALPRALQEAIRPIIAWITDEERRRTQDQKMQKMRPALQETEKLFRSSNRRHALKVALIAILLLIAAGVAVYFYVPWISRR